MQAVETWLDKSEYGDGPWQHEPDRIEWRAHGLPCLMLRNERFGNWCGYVGVPPGHPWHGLNAGEYGDGVDLDVHGGVTFVGRCMQDERPPRERVCHVPQPGESGDVWWFGFDCHHFTDYAPLFAARERRIFGDRTHVFNDGTTYRTAEYVRAEVERLGVQLAGVALA